MIEVLLLYSLPSPYVSEAPWARWSFHLDWCINAGGLARATKQPLSSAQTGVQSKS